LNGRKLWPEFNAGLTPWTLAAFSLPARHWQNSALSLLNKHGKIRSFYFRPALEELEQAYNWLLERTTIHAPTWYDSIVDTIKTLATNPQRCPKTQQSGSFAREVRQLVHGHRQNTYRILFTIRDQSVVVLHVRHGARERM
jgi:plasmid stabilization system protein ParE